MYQLLLQFTGQIALDPARMVLHPPVTDSQLAVDEHFSRTLEAELSLATRNTEAILGSLSSSLSRVMSCILYVSSARLPAPLRRSRPFQTEMIRRMEKLLATSCAESTRADCHSRSNSTDSNNASDDNEISVEFAVSLPTENAPNVHISLIACAEFTHNACSD